MEGQGAWPGPARGDPSWRSRRSGDAHGPLAPAAPPRADAPARPLPDVSAGRDRTARVSLILREVEALPTLPPVAQRVITIAGVDDPDLDALIEVIESDPALAARVLSMCRRADLGLGDRITTVRRAVLMLGLDAVQAAVLGVMVHDLFPGQSSPGPADEGACEAAPLPRHDVPSPPRLDRAGFWRHSLAVACAAELLTQRQRHMGLTPGEAFLGGLLHGLGRLVLDLLLPRTYAQVLAIAEARQCASALVESEIIGLDHHTAGKRLGEHWQLPPAIRDVMWLYAQPPEALPDLPHRALVALVAVARALCRTQHLGYSGDFDQPPALTGPTGLAQRAGVDPAVLPGLTPTLHDNLARRLGTLGLGQGSATAVLTDGLTRANRRLARLALLFEQRARVARRQTLALNALASFHENLARALRPGQGVVDILAQIVRSAAGLLAPAAATDSSPAEPDSLNSDPLPVHANTTEPERASVDPRAYFAVVLQRRSDRPWELFRFDREGRLLRGHAIETPAGAGGAPAGLADVSNVAGMPVISALAAWPWLADHLADAPDLRAVHALALSGEGDGATRGPGAILLYAGDPGILRDALIRRALTRSWFSALAAAVAQEGSAHLGEQLAAANRVLTQMQATLTRSQSLARVGELAAGVAHELNNPLTVISGRAQMVREAAGSEKTRQAAEAIIAAAHRASDLIAALSRAVQPLRPRRSQCPLNALLAEAVAWAARRTGQTPRVAVSCPDPPPVLSVDRELLAEALGEVIANAMEASSDTPVVVRAETVPPDSRQLITVQDRGRGMTPRAREHAFDPFFSEKPAGRGLGLGLTRARQAIEAHGGEIVLASQEGEGTTVTIALPGTCLAREGAEVAANRTRTEPAVEAA